MRTHCQLTKKSAKTIPPLNYNHLNNKIIYRRPGIAANISFLEEWLIEKTAERPELKWIVINCRGINSINSIDETAIMGLEDLISNYRSRGIEILFAGMKLPVSDRVQRAGWDEKLGENMSYRTTRDAIRAIGLPAECEPHGSEPR